MLLLKWVGKVLHWSRLRLVETYIWRFPGITWYGSEITMRELHLIFGLKATLHLVDAAIRLYRYGEILSTFFSFLQIACRKPRWGIFFSMGMNIVNNMLPVIITWQSMAYEFSWNLDGSLLLSHPFILHRCTFYGTFEQLILCWSTFFGIFGRFVSKLCSRML